MLILSGTHGESFMISDNVKVTIIEIKGHQVRLGFSAPDEVPIHRQKVCDAIQRDKRNGTRQDAE